ncbi:MAG: AAA family ATPase [Bdellovibrionota bacterium]
MSQFDSIVAGALDIAQTEVFNRRNPKIEPVHLLYGLVQHPDTACGKNLKSSKKQIISLMDQLPITDKSTFDVAQVKSSSTFSEWITKASSRAIQAGRREIGEGDLLAYIKDFFPDLSIDMGKFDQSTDEQEVPNFLVNLNELANQGKLDPVIGRTREIRAMMEILGRRRKNNPVLVGEAGVGKTAAIEGLADLIVKGNVPDAIKDKTIYSLDMGALMAGTKYRGEFEERMQKLVKFIKESAGSIILFIDEIHQIVGAGKTDGAMDASNLLKPALARGELHCIGATTYDEFQKYILKDSALERRFRAVPINEPSEEDAIEIMMGLKEKFEIHHGVDISDDAIFASVFLSKQYMPDKNLPDKSIDLIDEAASALKLSAEAMPPHLIELESEIRAKMIYSKTEKSDDSLLQEIADLQKRFEIEKADWQREVMGIKRLSELKNKMDRLKFDLEKAQASQDYELASQIKYSLMPEVEEELSKCKITFTLTKKDVAQVIARQTGIPLEKILKSKQENILELEPYLCKRVYGQSDALSEISETLIASHAGLSDQTRPLGSFLLLGPSGVGKTETAKALTQFLFDSEDNLIRFDLSEFSEKHSVAKLIGAPAGYVGYEEGGVLTEAIRRKPYSVILLDEVEKAHPDFSDILLQILDDGRLTDNKGRTVSFRNAILIITSNSKDYKREFKPEVLGRFDAILSYHQLDESIMSKLVERRLMELNAKLKSKGISVRLQDSVIEEIAKRGFDPSYGARPLASVFSKLIVRPLSHRILSGDIAEGIIEARLDNSGRIDFTSA